MNSTLSLSQNVFHRLSKMIPQTLSIRQVKKLKGSASERKFFRVVLEQSARRKPETLVLMQMPRPGALEETDYLLMQKHFRKCGIRVPQIHHHDKKLGLVLMEDGGDRHLQQALTSGKMENRMEHYRKALRTLLDIQLHAGPRGRLDCLAFHREFDQTKLMWELNFTLKHFVKGYLGKKLKPERLRKLRSEFRHLCRIITFEPKVLAHRDYHSRNILCKDSELILIDFQDARMGCPQYDLVSLLRDSYFSLSNRVRLQLVDEYIRFWERRVGERMDRERFFRVFDAMALQRNLKALGTFGFQVVRKKNRSFERYIRPTVRYIIETLIDRPEWNNLTYYLKALIQ